jgi:hypothetical protein
MRWTSGSSEWSPVAPYEFPTSRRRSVSWRIQPLALPSGLLQLRPAKIIKKMRLGRR